MPYEPFLLGVGVVFDILKSCGSLHCTSEKRKLKGNAAVDVQGFANLDAAFLLTVA